LGIRRVQVPSAGTGAARSPGIRHEVQPGAGDEEVQEAGAPRPTLPGLGHWSRMNHPLASCVHLFEEGPHPSEPGGRGEPTSRRTRLAMERGNTMMTTPRERARRAPIAGLVAAAAATGALSLLPASSAGASNAVTVSAQTIGKMGKVLVIKGKAAYTLVPSSSPCNAACLKIWPAVTVPATVTKVGAGAGVQQSTLGVTTGPGGTHQVT
jgi:predicted lipoprotein with Yx(FWY)xxD motif